MAGTGVIKTKTLLLRSCRAKPVGRRFISKVSRIAEADKSSGSINNNGDQKPDNSSSSSSCWVPHPRTGIYFPQGHEWVMEDVPDCAGSFGPSYWLRSIDGADKPDPDNYHDSVDQNNALICKEKK